jgi:hypothetical protein
VSEAAPNFTEESVDDARRTEMMTHDINKHANDMLPHMHTLLIQDSRPGITYLALRWIESESHTIGHRF